MTAIIQRLSFATALTSDSASANASQLITFCLDQGRLAGIALRDQKGAHAEPTGVEPLHMRCNTASKDQKHGPPWVSAPGPASSKQQRLSVQGRSTPDRNWKRTGGVRAPCIRNLHVHDSASTSNLVFSCESQVRCHTSRAPQNANIVNYRQNIRGLLSSSSSSSSGYPLRPLN